MGDAITIIAIVLCGLVLAVDWWAWKHQDESLWNGYLHVRTFGLVKLKGNAHDQ
jgi:hypothetical protein